MDAMKRHETLGSEKKYFITQSKSSRQELHTAFVLVPRFPSSMRMMEDPGDDACTHSGLPLKERNLSLGNSSFL